MKIAQVNKTKEDLLEFGNFTGSGKYSSEILGGHKELKTFE